MCRRGESIYKRADGRWEARYIHHYENGKAKYRFLYADTYLEVKSKRTEEMSKADFCRVTRIKSCAKFYEISSLWLEDIKSKVKESTYTRYYRVVDKYLNTVLGNISIVKLDKEIIKKFIVELSVSGGIRHKGLSAKTVSDMLCILKSIFKFGAASGYPCCNLSTVSQPKVATKPINILSKESKIKLIKALLNSSDRVSLGILFTLFTGVRIGELCGIKQEDIDLASCTVKISRTVERIADLSSKTEHKTKVIISVPKTNTSYRIIPIPKFLVDYIKNFNTNPNCFILTGKEKNTEPHQFYLRYKTYLKKVGIESYSFHALRHTFATSCVENGFDPKSLSEILGHSNISTTLSIYVHPTLEQKRALMERLTPCILNI